ncbi:protein NipSnap homolog 3A-like isoform X2 [Apostichopus japonicus]|uniref:protein NipSnap homolog 3A-like isoform X2 n=1 Tax=Stichopus japonicus TaxID=307972 RepID=UPI003AB581AD
MSDITVIKTLPPGTSKLYELRIYSIKPSCMGNYLQITKGKYHLRKAHSKLVGSWITEIGDVNEALHLWEYDNLSHRASVRAALGADRTWKVEYANEAHEYFDRQHSQLLSVPWGTVATEPFVEGGIYQLCALQVRSDAANMDIDKFSQITSIQERLLSEKKTGKLMGVFTTQIGDCDTVYQLWNYKTMDDVLECKEALDNNSFYRSQGAFVKVSSKLLTALTSVSPLL